MDGQKYTVVVEGNDNLRAVWKGLHQNVAETLAGALVEQFTGEGEWWYDGSWDRWWGNPGQWREVRIREEE